MSNMQTTQLIYKLQWNDYHEPVFQHTHSTESHQVLGSFEYD